ncbi:MAG: hypothetical protein IJD94_02280 [Clostridia bacterium]|nr:hypothetical protein [Clostridia bacterium]
MAVFSECRGKQRADQEHGTSKKSAALVEIRIEDQIEAFKELKRRRIGLILCAADRAQPERVEVMHVFYGQHPVGKLIPADGKLIVKIGIDENCEQGVNQKNNQVFCGWTAPPGQKADNAAKQTKPAQNHEQRA